MGLDSIYLYNLITYKYVCCILPNIFNINCEIIKKGD